VTAFWGLVFGLVLLSLRIDGAGGGGGGGGVGDTRGVFVWCLLCCAGARATCVVDLRC